MISKKLLGNWWIASREVKMDNLDSIINGIRKDLTEKDEAREKLLPLCRDSIRFSSGAIRAIHRQEFTEAEEFIKQAGDLVTEAQRAVRGINELNSTGIIRDAQKELVEATLVLAIVKGKPLPPPRSIAVESAAYLNGLAEAASEIRRYLLDNMRKGDLSRGEELLSVMDDIYSLLVTIDYPDAITGGLRRSTDMLRGVLERTRSDLTLAIRQKELESKLSKLPDDIPASLEEAMSEEKMTESSAEEPQLDDRQMKIYNELVAWRERKATEENLTPNIIARNATLKEIITRNPETTRELLAIKGFGERRANKYGRDILAILKGFSR
jgi:translin